MTAEIPLAALGRLNVHARATRISGQRDAIYAYKLLAALTLTLERRAHLRFVKWTGKCGHCDNGRFTHWEWDDGYSVACRDCGGTGVRTLRFTETPLPDGQIWHHPWNGRTLPGLDLARAIGVTMCRHGDYQTADGAALEWHDAGAWHPRLPAEALPLEELAGALNEVEDWVAALPDRRDVVRWPLDHARRCLRQQKHARIIGEPSHSYSLHLGRAPGGCFVCGDEQDLDSICFGRMTPLFHWSLPVCKAHRNAPHPKDPPPDTLITPQVRRWLDRHQQIEEVR